MYGSDRSRALDYERTVVVQAEKKAKSFSKRMEKSAQKVFGRADIVRDVQLFRRIEI